MNDIRESLDNFISEQLSEKLIQAIDELPRIPQLTKKQRAVVTAVARRMGLSLFSELPRLVCHLENYVMNAIKIRLAEESKWLSVRCFLAIRCSERLTKLLQV